MKKIVSFTTIPTRIKMIKPMIDSLLAQSLAPDEIILWVPNSYKRIKTEISEIPDFIKDSNIKVELCEDMGPFTKLFYALKREWENKETIIVTVDDDVYYPTKWFEGLVRQSIKTPNKAIGYRGRILIDKLNYNTSKKLLGAPKNKPIKVDVITGNWGALYKPKFFDEEVFDPEIINSNLFVDDIWITGNLSKNKIKKIILKNIGIRPILEIHEIDSLWSLNKSGSNNDKMLDYFKGVI